MAARDLGEEADEGGERTTDDFQGLLREAARISVPTDWATSLAVGSTLANGRLQVVRPLRRGGMGVVYEVHDAARREHVALKLLTRSDAADVYRLKNEFRALTRIAHPNVVRFYELFAEDARWFFTMELVHGASFLDWTRPEGVLEPERLRAATAQLLAGVDAIHRAGKLHRDLKPENVLVTPTGRVVVLDLGLAIDPDDGGIGRTRAERTIAGTPAYMSPEQAAGGYGTVSSDHYAIGVMLYEALTGRLPFDGDVMAVLATKQRELAPPIGDGLAPELRALAVLSEALLAIDPGARPDAAQLAACFGVVPVREREPTAYPDRAPLLDGREQELAILTEALQATRAQRCMIVTVVGESGIGKTALCDAFLHAAREEHGAVVLAGRCFEHESVPYKALDPLIDALTRHLRALPEVEAAAVLPRDAGPLVQLIPSFARAEVVRSAPMHLPEDPEELQRRAFGALAELLARMRDRGLVVVHIDDLQWSDADSLSGLCSVLQQAPPLLFLLSERPATGARESSNSARLCAAAQHDSRCAVRTIALAGLPEDAATRIASRLLDGPMRKAAPELVREAHGNPFVLGELCLLVGAPEGGLAVASVSTLVARRVASLDAPARSMLELLALAGVPLRVSVLLAAADATIAHLDVLEAARLARGTPRQLSTPRLIECYHDRIREQLVTSIDEPRRAFLWARLAEALRGEEDARDDELLCRSLEGAGDEVGASAHAARAATQAASQLAFERAAVLYARALALGTHTAAETLTLSEALARALKHAGHGAEAAGHFRAAAALAHGDHRLDLERRAADELLAIGRTSEARSLLRAVCAEIEIALPTGTPELDDVSSERRNSLRFAPVSVYLRRPTPTGRARLRLDASASVVRAYHAFVVARAGGAAMQCLEVALELGDARDVVRALGVAASVAASSRTDAAWARMLLDHMDELVEAVADPELLAYASRIHGVVLYYRGSFRKARDHFLRSRASTRPMAGLGADLVAFYDQATAFLLGDYADIARSTPVWIDDAHRRGRVWIAALLSGYAGAVGYLTPDRPEAYRRRLELALAHYPRVGSWSWPHYLVLFGEVFLSIYEGRPEHGLALLEAHHRELAGGNAGSALVAALQRGEAAVSALRNSAGARAEQLVAIAASASAALRGHGEEGIEASAEAIEAALALRSGERVVALARLRRAIRIGDEHDLRMYAAAGRRRLGQLLGGDEGAALIREGEAFMHAQGVLNLEAMTEVHCPGFPPSA